MLSRRRRKLPLESLGISDTASGTFAIRLTNKVTPDEFAAYARRLLAVLEGKVEKKMDSPFERLWEVRIRQKPFWLACDEAGVSLEPRDDEARTLVPDLHQWLLDYRETKS